MILVVVPAEEILPERAAILLAVHGAPVVRVERELPRLNALLRAGLADPA